jgi:D-alanyl-D-alanine carboxypeptidase
MVRLLLVALAPLLGLFATMPAASEVEDPVPPFSATSHSVTAKELGLSWHPGCPVGPDQLRMVVLSYIGMDRLAHQGQLVVNADRVDELITIFRQLYQLRYPIVKMITPDHYANADDELSMEDNNTSAYNCRDIPGTGHWSYHAYGRAIDINPLINPYHDAHGVQPKNGGPYLDRSRTDPGLLHNGDQTVLAFTNQGWTWGGHWTDPIDYQHFERP